MQTFNLFELNTITTTANNSGTALKIKALSDSNSPFTLQWTSIFNTDRSSHAQTTKIHL